MSIQEIPCEVETILDRIPWADKPDQNYPQPLSATCSERRPTTKCKLNLFRSDCNIHFQKLSIYAA